jgi:hypothetical protein
LLIGTRPGPKSVVKANRLPVAEALHGREQIKERVCREQWNNRAMDGPGK